MMHRRGSGWTALLGIVFLLHGNGPAVAGAYTAGPGDLVAGNIVVTVDENGHGTINGFVGPQPLSFALQNDPGPGGLANV